MTRFYNAREPKRMVAPWCVSAVHDARYSVSLSPESPPFSLNVVANSAASVETGFQELLVEVLSGAITFE